MGFCGCLSVSNGRDTVVAANVTRLYLLCHVELVAPAAFIRLTWYKVQAGLGGK